LKKKKAASKTQKRSACALPRVGQVVRVGEVETEKLSGTELFTQIAMVLEQGFAVADNDSHSIVERVWHESPGGRADYQYCDFQFRSGQTITLKLSRNQQNPAAKD